MAYVIFTELNKLKRCQKGGEILFYLTFRQGIDKLFFLINYLFDLCGTFGKIDEFRKV